MKNDKKQIKEQVLHVLADLYCDYNTIPIDQLQDLALFLYTNCKYGPKGTKEIASALYALEHAIHVRIEALPSLSANGKKVCLGNIINPNFTPFYSEIAQKFQEIREMIQSPTLDFYLGKNLLNKYNFILKNEDKKLERAFLERFNMSMNDFFTLNCKSLTGAYSYGKILDAFIDEYYHPVVKKEEKIVNHPVSKEVIRDFFDENTELEDTMLTKAQELVNQLHALLETTEDSVKRKSIEETIFALQVAMISRSFANLHEIIEEALKEEPLKR